MPLEYLGLYSQIAIPYSLKDMCYVTQGPFYTFIVHIIQAKCD